MGQGTYRKSINTVGGGKIIGQFELFDKSVLNNNNLTVSGPERNFQGGASDFANDKSEKIRKITTDDLFFLMYCAFNTRKNRTDLNFITNFLHNLNPKKQTSGYQYEHAEFAGYIKNKTIGKDLGYSLIVDYISSIRRADVLNPIKTYFDVSKIHWIDMAQKYLKLFF